MNFVKLLELRPLIAKLISASEAGLAILKADIADGQLSGELAFLQPHFAEVKALVAFLDVVLEIRTILGL